MAKLFSELPSEQHPNDASIKFLQSAIQIDTVSLSGDEQALAGLIAAQLGKAGIQSRLHPLDGRRANLIATLDSGVPGPTLVLSGHLHTVPVGTAQWSYDPFGAVIDDGVMYGRGTVDMKSGLCALMFAMIRHAQRPGTHWCGKVVFAATSCEEVGSKGAQALVKAGLLPQFDALIIAEPTNCRPVIAHKGAYWTRICSHGKASHSSMPEKGVNAIDNMFRLYRQLSNVDLQVPDHPLLSPPTPAVTQISGGKQPNVSPDRCELTIDMRTLPGQAHTNLAKQMQDLAGEVTQQGPNCRFELETLLDIPGVSTRPEAAIVQVARHVLQQAGASEHDVQPRGATYFTDGSVPQARGQDILVLGPGDPGLAHQVDEHVAIADYLSMIDIYEEILGAYLVHEGAEEPGPS